MRKNMSTVEDVRFSVTLPKDLIERMEAAYPLSNSRSRNDFIKKAIQFYNVYLQLDGEADVFADIVGSTVKAELAGASIQNEAQRKKDVEQLARNQFKIATELSKIALIISDNLKIPTERISDLHVQAVNEVKSINGILEFEERVQ